MTTWRGAAVLAGTAAFALAGCGGSHRDEHEETAGPAHRTTVNPSTFPLYRGSEVYDVVRVDLRPMAATIKKNDPSSETGESYDGHEVVAVSAAPLSRLNAWVRALAAAPPQGLHVSRRADSSAEGNRNVLRSTGATVATFRSADESRVVMLIVLDPKTVRAKIGPALDAIETYRSVPGVMRGAIDEAAKKQLGYSVSEMLDPGSPVGVLVNSVKALQAQDKRAIVVIDETKAR